MGAFSFIYSLWGIIPTTGLKAKGVVMKKHDFGFVVIAVVLAALFVKLPVIGGGYLWALIAHIAN